jgi:hypothetical protein
VHNLANVTWFTQPEFAHRSAALVKHLGQLWQSFLIAKHALCVGMIPLPVHGPAITHTSGDIGPDRVRQSGCLPREARGLIAALSATER